MTIKDNVARRTVSTFLLFLLASGTASSQGFQGSDTNYSNCVAGLSFGCRPDLLTDAQRAKVRQAQLARNYSNCVAGLSFGCRFDLLTDAQRAKVRQAQLARNYSNCVAGLSFGCRLDLLTDAQRAKVRQAQLARNYSNCVAGLSFGCRFDLLTDAQRAKVRQAQLARNYSNCVAGLSFGCRLDLLTDAQRRGIKSKWESQAQDAVSQVTVPCAENGSCYGDISVATSRPKTVHVKGYYRRDGTYVRGHYRSKPRR